MKEIITAICKNCNRSYFKLKSPAKHANVPAGIRQSNTVCCSPRCSREYDRSKCKRRKDKLRKQ